MSADLDARPRGKLAAHADADPEFRAKRRAALARTRNPWLASLTKDERRRYQEWRTLLGSRDAAREQIERERAKRGAA